MPAGKKSTKENEASENGATGGWKKEEFIHEAKDRLAALPNVRPDRIRKACLRAAQGFYDRPPVLSKIADRFLEEMGID